MLGQQWLQFVVALCLVFAPHGLQAGYPVVGRSAGTLAVQTAPTSTWRVISVGGILPDAGEARTTATGASHLQCDHGSLSLGALSQVKYDLTTRQVTLLAGKVFCAPANDKPWTVNAGTAVVVIPSGGIEVALDEHEKHNENENENVIVTSLRGVAKVTNAGPALTVEERMVCKPLFRLPKAMVKPLEPAAAEHLAAWTKQLPPGQGVGQLVIKDSQGGTGTRLNIAHYHADVVLQPPVALVKLDQSFYNPSSRQEEGEFIFNLPPGASVSRFSMFVTKDDLIEGEVIERKQADQVYTSIVRSKRDPAILEQIGDQLFKMRVFPIFAKDTKRILLDFTLPLDGRDGQYQMQLPLLSNLLPIWDFRLSGVIRGPTPLASAQCPTIPGLKFASSRADEITFKFEERNYQPISDLVVAFQQQTPQAVTTFRQLRAAPLRLPVSNAQPPTDAAAALNPDGSITKGWDKWNSESGTYFQADLPVPPNATGATPADVLLLVDTSGNGTLQQVRPALQTVLGNLRAEDRFRLVCVDVVSRPLHEGWLQPQSPAARAAYQQFEQQICLGASDMLATCKDIGSQFANHDPARRPVMIYIGDGLHSVDDTSLQVLAQRCAREIAELNAPLFTINTLPPSLPPQQEFGIGGFGGMGGGYFQFGPIPMPGMSSSGRGRRSTGSPFDGRLFLTQLTKHAGGRNFDFTDVQGDRSRLFEWLLSGLPTPTRIEKFSIGGCEPIDLYYPANLLPGEAFRITGRKLGDLEMLEITYKINGPEAPWQSIELTPAASTEDHLVGRYWAAQRLRHLQRLMAAPANGGGNPEAGNVIVGLSREWSLLTPQTAFLVLETEADYQRWNVPRQGRRRYWQAQDVPTVQPLPADWLAKIRPPKNQEDQEKFTGDVEVDQHLEAARQALADQKYNAAARILDHLKDNEVALKSNHYRNLRLQLANRQGIPLDSLGVKQGWFDLQSVRLALPNGTDRLLTNFGTITSELLERHPFAEQLLQEINLSLDDMSLAEFSQFLRVTLGINTSLDTRNLEEESIGPHVTFRLPKLKKISMFNAIHHVLDQKGLALIEEPRRLLITTKTEAIQKRKRILFPVRDLLLKNPKFNLDDLQDPFFDRDQAAIQRIETKLKKVVSIRLDNDSLNDVIARFRSEMDENVLVDHVRLEEENIATDAADIGCDYTNVPLGNALTWLLDTKGLTFNIAHEALIVTTKTHAITHRPVRVYPLQGLLFRDTKPGSRSQMGAGWAMAGGFGGMAGGMGFGGFGMGGMGGLGGVAVGSSFESSTSDAMSVQVMNAVDSDPDVSEQSSQSDSSSTEATDLDQFENNAGDILMAVQQQTGGPPDAPWMEADGEGGSVGFFYPSLSFVFRQTPAAHVEIADFFRQQRALQTRRGTNPDMVPLLPKDALSRSEHDIGPLIMLIQQVTGGPPDSPWHESDGEGGLISYDRPRVALSIRQTPETLDEIAGLLVRLRRERFALLHESRPWENATFLGRQSGLFDGPWLAKNADPNGLTGSANEPELAVLKVRRELGSGHWKWNGNASAASSNFNLLTAGDRLQLSWKGWEARFKGAEGAIYAPRLRYAELGNWGQGLRDWLDLELVFWPHRSNQELASLFNVEAVPADKNDAPNHVRLQFSPAKFEQQPVWIQVVYDKTTGLPVLWESYKLGALVQRFRIQPEVNDGKLSRLTVKQEAPDGEVLGAGEWTPTAQDTVPVDDPLNFPDGTITVDRRPNAQPTQNAFQEGWQSMQKGDNALAETQFRKALEKYPDHPLGQFLLAWSVNRQLTDAPQERTLAAYAAVIQNGPSELARSLIKLDGGRFSDQQLYELLKGRPVDQRDFDDELTLTKQSLHLNAPAAALEHAEAAWRHQPESNAQRLEVAQLILQSQLKLGQSPAAQQRYAEFRQTGDFTIPQLMQLLESFEYVEKSRDISQFYRELLERKDPAISVEMKRTLLKKYANATTGMERWQALLKAINLLPVNSLDADLELDRLGSELTDNRVPGPAAALAETAKSPAVRHGLQFVQANLTPDLAAAQKLYWQLHQEGYLFRYEPVLVGERLIEAKHPEQAVAILEALVRAKRDLTLQQRRTLANAYRLTNRPLDAKRAMSE